MMPQGCHSDSGYTHQPRGFYAQLIYGESFEGDLPVDITLNNATGPTAMPTQAPTAAFKRLPPLGRPGLGLRHCSYELFATRTEDKDDFRWLEVPAINGANGGISFKSRNYPTHYICPYPNPSKHGLEPGRLGLVAPATAADRDGCSWRKVPGLADPKNASLASFVNLATQRYLSLNGNLSGACAHEYSAAAGESDAVLLASADATASAAARANATFASVPDGPDPSTNTRSIAAWRAVSSGGHARAPGEVAVDHATFFHGTQSLRLSFASGGADPVPDDYTVGAANRGLGGEGLFLEGGKEYEGYLFVNSPAASITLEVRLEDYGGGTGTGTGTGSSPSPAPAVPTVLARQTLGPLATGGGFKRVAFSLTPSAGTACGSVDPSLPSEATGVECGKVPDGVAGHICIRCWGQFVVALAAASPAGSAVHVDYVYLSAGAWGRYNGLPVLKSAVDNLLDMGINVIRQGGSFTDGSGYDWKRWRGPPWARESIGWVWRASLVSAWGPFEMSDLCAAAGIEMVFTTAAENDGGPNGPATECCTPEYMADLVEYCWGDNSTTWGQQRIADGHPDNFPIRFFELGNEQYNSKYVEQAAAMEARAKAVGQGGKLVYLFPQNKYLNATDYPKAEALGYGDRLVPDFHVGAGGAVQQMRALIAAHNGTGTFGGANAETNAGTHHMQRALEEAADLNVWFNASDVASRLWFRTASFCTERSGHFDSFDQGISFFLPNMTWLQPPGYVHKMLQASWQGNNVRAVLDADGLAGQSASAQVSEGHAKQLVVRYVNGGATPVAVNLSVANVGGGSWLNCATTTLSADDANDANPPGDPERVAPKKGMWGVRGGKGTLTVPGLSVTNLECRVSES